MRMLFNHGLTCEELYTNTPEKIIDRKWTWFIKRYGITNSYEDAISDPFKYCFGLVINRIIDEKVRFKIPVNADAYIDFEIVLEEQFEAQRQNGRFQGIDFIESDFTGYFLRYYFKGKTYKRSYPIYLGGELKKKFLEGINSGEKYYTIKDITINDFIEDVHKKFKDLTVKEIKDLLVHGFRRLHSAIRSGCVISINTRKKINCIAYIGEIFLNPEKQMKEYSERRDRKLRMIEIWKHLDFDGYYYIGLNHIGFENWLAENKTSRTINIFKRVMIRKIKDEFYYKYKQVHIFRFKIPKFKGWLFWADEIKVKGLEYVGESNSHIFVPSTKTWKELRKEYEERCK